MRQIAVVEYIYFFTHSFSRLDDVHGSEALGVKRF